MVARPGAWRVALPLLIAAAGPIQEGGELSAEGGVGTLERRQWLFPVWQERRAHGGAQVAFRGRPHGSGASFTALLGGARAEVSDALARYPRLDEEAPIGKTETLPFGAARFGYHGTRAGIEAGAAADLEARLLAPSLALWLGHERGRYLFGGLFDQTPLLWAPLARLGVGARHPRARVEVSAGPSWSDPVRPAVRADADVRLSRAYWIGAAGYAVGSGRMGPQWAATARITWAFGPPAADR